MNDISKFKFYSIGYVAKDIDYDSQYIDIFPVELQPGKDGDVNQEKVIKNTIEDMEGHIEKLEVKKTSLIKAKWLAIGEPNRLEPPTVCKGESVLLYRYANSDAYYWSNIYNELHYRKREKYSIVLSNRPHIAKDDEDLSKVYSLTIDTISKHLTLHTGDEDGEVTSYDFVLDGGEGFAVLTDGKENSISLDSNTSSIVLKSNNSVKTITTDESSEVKTLTNNISNSKKETIGSSYNIDLKTFSMSNGADELISLLSELIQANIDVMHIGNLGIPTEIEPVSEQVYKDIQSRLDAFKG